jgi:phosphoribosylamine--glycine ligase
LGINILVIGSGGREHALSWKLSQSAKVGKVYTAPGNGGTSNNVPIPVEDIENLAKFASDNNCFTIVGPEAPLAMGIVDEFNKRGLDIFGPTKKAAQLESSKIWAKQFMKRNSIPTAKFEIFDNVKDATNYIDHTSYNVVVKADGLAAGKGVIVCNDKQQAKSAVSTILDKKVFGEAGNRIIIEERIGGIEASYIAISDGKIAVPMASSQDHKRISDGDKGDNTGGMGAYSPTPFIDELLESKIQTEVIDKTINAMNSEDMPFKGFLYAGIMITEQGEPYVLEFNVRMGDPECQPIIMRMDFDLYDYLNSSVQGNLSLLGDPTWKKQSAVCVVMASEGYPKSYKKDETITGLDKSSYNDKMMVFHAGTKKDDVGNIRTSGGRVLGVTAMADDLKQAIDNAYHMTEHISWPHKYYRTDIGKKGLKVHTKYNH